MLNRFFLKPKWSINLNSLLIISAMMFAIVPTARAQDLLLAPFRVVFDGGSRAQEVALVNRGGKRGNYRIEFVNMVLNDKGELVESNVAANGEKFAKDYLRASVRQVELDPGETQMIRIALRKPADLPVGEYRTHLMVRSLPYVQPPSLDTATKTDVKFELLPAYGMTIPVLVRQGRSEASATVSSARLGDMDADGWGVLYFDLKRKGERSLFVDVDIIAQSPKGKGIWVTSARGVSLYAPYTDRQISLQLNKAQVALLKDKKLRFLVTEIDANGKQIAKPVEAIF